MRLRASRPTRRVGRQRQPRRSQPRARNEANSGLRICVSSGTDGGLFIIGDLDMVGSPVADVVIAGGGIIGLSLGLELLQRGLSVTVIERQQAMSSASWAAGGMLAVHDPQNP